MGRLSNNIVRYLSSVALFLSICVLSNGIWLSRQATTQCEIFLNLPLVTVALFFIILSLMGMAGAFLGIDLLLWINVISMFFLIVFLLSFNLFAFVVTNKPYGVYGSGRTGTMIGNHCNWLKKRTNKNWNKISTCLQENKICAIKNNGRSNALGDYSQNLTSIMSGCCKVPNDCSNSSSRNPDCSKWSTDQKVLCYGCESCKAGWMNNIKSNWRRVTGINFILISFLVLVVAPTTPV
ncbi:tetraspanin-8-like [Impatiens glandulifera]|uniref:tetraspanin-8-like n=1 Tax=Impatiens glandulifera TaxID=253017 RepID=UPI001FB0A859|nr:tetraspanin-8-like [Impatiens glandulifera]